MKLFLLPEHQEILFARVFGTSVLNYVLRFHHKVKGLGRFVLVVPRGLGERVTITLADDSIVKRISVQIEEAAADQLIEVSHDPQALPLNRIYFDQDHFVDVASFQDLKDFRAHVVQGIRLRSSTPVAKQINKRLSLVLSQWLAFLRISPNTISLTAIFFSFLGGLCLFFPVFFFWGFVCFQINSLLDGCDGEVAWMNVAFSPLGKKLDIYGDYLTTVIIIVCEGLGLSLITDRLWVSVVAGFSIMTLICIGLIWLSAMIQGLISDNLAEVEGQCHAALKNPKNLWDKLHAVFLFISRRDFYILTLFVLACFKLFFVIHLFILICTIAWFMLSLYTMALLRKLKR